MAANGVSVRRPPSSARTDRFASIGRTRSTIPLNRNADAMSTRKPMTSHIRSLLIFVAMAHT